MFGEFKKFALRGNVIDMAVGFTVGAAFTTVVRSLVDDLLMPPIGLLLGNVDFTDLFLVLKDGPTAPPPYETLEAAKGAGAVTLNYGLFLNSVIAFLIVAFAIFLVVRAVNRLERSMERQAAIPAEPQDKKCPYCIMTIPAAATRCAHCTATL